MSVITGKGKNIKEQMKKQKQQKEENKIDFKKVKINKDLKKEGDSVRVRLLTAEDFTTYESHGFYNKGIYTAPCINPTGDGEQRCLFCEASKFEGWEELAGKTRFLFAFFDIDAGIIRYIDVSYTQGTSLMDDIEEFEDSIEDFAFTLKRSGTGTKTTYKLSPIMKLNAEDKEKFNAGDGQKVPEEFYEKVLYVKSTNQQAIDLENAGFDVEGLLGYTIVNEDQENEEAQEDKSEEVPPEKVF